MSARISHVLTWIPSYLGCSLEALPADPREGILRAIGVRHSLSSDFGSFTTPARFHFTSVTRRVALLPLKLKLRLQDGSRAVCFADPLLLDTRSSVCRLSTSRMQVSALQHAASLSTDAALTRDTLSAWLELAAISSAESESTQKPLALCAVSITVSHEGQHPHQHVRLCRIITTLC